jgi:acetyltransferase-like isoleucine patch superfamily enzyme
MIKQNEKKTNNHIDPHTTIALSSKIMNNVDIRKNVIIHDFVTVYPNVIIEESTEIFEGAVIGKPPSSIKVVSRPVSTGQKTIIGKGCIISPHVTIYSDVIIGEMTLIGDNASIREQCRIGSHCLIARNVAINYNTKIGDFTKIMDTSVITGNMVIGSHVFISLLVATTNDNEMGRSGYNEEKIRGPIIEDYACIGAGANLLPGVKIGKGAIVGAGSVVTKDVPAKKVVMGIPARIIRDVEEDKKQG